MKEEARLRKKEAKAPTEASETKVDTATKPKSGRWCGFCIQTFFYTLVILSVYLYFAPCPIDPLAIRISEVPPEMPPDELTTLITTPATLKLPGAECFVVHEPTGYVYTGLATGEIARFKLELSEPEILMRTGTALIIWLFACVISTIVLLGSEKLDSKLCAEAVRQSEPTCGRPLGMRLLDDQNLLVIDAFIGIFQVNIEKLTKELILNFSEADTEKPILLGDDLVILPDSNTVYFTDVSYEHDLRDFLYELAEMRPRGRLFKFSLDTRKLTLVADELYFSNGIELHKDGTFLLVTETTMARVLSYSLEDGKIGVFADNLLGLPDNIRRSPRGGYWIGMGAIRKWPFLTDIIAQYPIINRMV